MKRNVTKVPSEAPSVDWSASPSIDRTRLETGFFKFPGLFENRGQERISQRELGRVAISMRFPGRKDWSPVKLWDFTSISFGVHYTPINQAGRQEAGGTPLQINDEIEILIRVGEHEEFQIWCQVKNTVAWQDGIKIGLRRLDVAFPQPVDVERRETYRLPLAPALSLKARVKHPFIYGYWCPLQVSDVNRKMGLSLISQDPSILLFEGMELKIHFEMAAFRSVPMIARVMWVHATEANEVKFGVACMEMEWSLHNGLCDFLLYSRHWTPSRLRRAGFRAQQVKGHLRFRSVKTMDDYADVLYLRRDAYVSAGKKPEGTSPEAMAGTLDGISRILMAHHRDELVGSITFTFPNSEETVLDSQAGFPGRKYPVALPPRANLIEVSRLCIHSEYRGTDLLQGLFEHGVKHFLMSDRHWLLTSAVDDLMPTYLRIGFVKLDASYKHPALNNSEHHLIMAHRDTFLWGKGMNVLVWTTLFGDLIQYLVRRKLVREPAWVLAIIRLKLLLKPFAKKFLDSRARTAFRKHLDALRPKRLKAPAEPDESREVEIELPASAEIGADAAPPEQTPPEAGAP